MWIREIGALAGGAAFVLLQGLPAAAIDDVTGTYTGKLSCRQIVVGAVSKLKQDITIEIAEGKGAGVLLDIDAGVLEVAHTVVAFMVEDVSKTDRGTLTGVECSLTSGNRLGAALHADVKIKAGSEKGTVKGTLIGMDEAGELAKICTFSAKRTSPAAPVIGPCL